MLNVFAVKPSFGLILLYVFAACVLDVLTARLGAVSRVTRKQQAQAKDMVSPQPRRLDLLLGESQRLDATSFSEDALNSRLPSQHGMTSLVHECHDRFWMRPGTPSASCRGLSQKLCGLTPRAASMTPWHPWRFRPLARRSARPGHRAGDRDRDGRRVV